MLVPKRAPSTQVLILGLVGSALIGCDLLERGVELAEKPSTADAQEATSPVPPVPTPVPSPTVPPPSGGVIPPVVAAHPPAGAAMSFADLAARSNPAVVFVRTLQSQRHGFRRILGEGSGSGFIFDPAGKILTNYHVVRGAHAIQVELQDGRALQAEVIGADPLTDVALLRVPAVDLPALPLGDSEAIRVGDWVVAIGNPFGLEHTVSAGIISAKERTNQDVQLGDPDAYYSFLQTDASINPGNSGGPLIDLNGRVVGINTAINQGANNIGFAIPVNMIADLLPRLLKDGKIQRAAIGVHVDDVSSEDIAQFSLSDRQGAMIVRVVRGGPADQAGVRAGDVMVEFDGHQIRSPEQLRWYASLSAVGQPVDAQILRGGKRSKVTMRPAPMQSK